jgi:hypothetical protein
MFELIMHFVWFVLGYGGGCAIYRAVKRRSVSPSPALIEAKRISDWNAMLRSSASMEHELEMMPHSSKELETFCPVCAAEREVEFYKQMVYRRRATVGEEKKYQKARRPSADAMKMFSDRIAYHDRILHLNEQMTINAGAIKADTIRANRIVSGMATPNEHRKEQKYG